MQTMAFTEATLLALALCFVCSAGLAAVSDPSSPDAQSGSPPLSLDGSIPESSSNSSSNSSSSSFSPVASNITSADAPAASPPPSFATTVPSASQKAVQTSDVSTSRSGTSASVPHDLKSMDNPFFLSFLGDFARQSRQTLQEVKAVALTDPQIELLWEIYVQTFALLPALGGAGTAASNPGSFGSGSTVPQFYQGGGQQSGAGYSAPTVNTNWFESFFKTPPQQPAAGSRTGTSYLQHGSQYGSRPGSAASSMDPSLSSFFRSPSSSQQQQYSQQRAQYSQQSGSGMNGMNLANSFLSIMSPVLQSLPTNQQYSAQPVQSGQAGTLPDSGWNIGPTGQSQPVRQPLTLSNATLQKLSNELLMLLGKLPSPPPTPGNTSASSSSTSSSPSQQTPSPQTKAPPATPATPAPTTQPQGYTQTATKVPEPPVFSSLVINTLSNRAPQTGGVPSLNLVSPPVNYGVKTPALGMPGQEQQQTLDAMASRMNALRPLVRFYNARYRAKASRDLGCRTLSEMLDMDVPRAMDLTCHRSCSAIMPGAVTGKRFGLRCLCCPAFVSDQAIGMRTLYRRAEALT